MSSNIQKAHIHFKGSAFKGSALYPTPEFIAGWLQGNMIYTKGASPKQPLNLGVTLDTAETGKDTIRFLLRDAQESNVVTLGAKDFKKAASVAAEFTVDLPKLFGSKNWSQYQSLNESLIGQDRYNIEDYVEEIEAFDTMHADMAKTLEATLVDFGLCNIYSEMNHYPIIQGDLLTTFLDYKDYVRVERSHGFPNDVRKQGMPMLVVRN